MDKGKLPCVLVENKADLLEGENTDEEKLKEFAKENGFDGVFRTSAKTGLNINESMECLILNIIKRMEDMTTQGNVVFNTNRASVVLNPNVHQEKSTTAAKRKKDGCC